MGPHKDPKQVFSQSSPGLHCACGTHPAQQNQTGHKGVYLIDKPQGLTSHDVVNVIKKRLKAAKVGHAGTLDPLATGLLIILVGREFTKRQGQFLKQNKQYQVTAKLGIETDTYDSDGRITKKAPSTDLQKIAEQDLIDILKKFQGEISQTVPPFSAVKIKGKKLYQLARQKKLPPQLPVKTVTINKLKLTSFDQLALKARMLVDCSSGTYIRSLVHDIGKALGVGAHVTKLRRTRINHFNVSQAVPLKEFCRKHSQPILL